MSEPFKLSKEQALAVKGFGSDLGVSAAAGSGKTTVLVERYLEAVTAKKAGPENVLAVTFTDKAANEMKRRLRRRLERPGMEDLRRKFDNAWIGTIHSFCLRLLKENPVECGVDPAFRVLGKGEQEMLMTQSMDRLYEEEASNETFVELLADGTEKSVREAMRYFYDKERSYAGEKALLRVEVPKKELAAIEKEFREALGEEQPSDKLKSACGAALEALKQGPGWGRRQNVQGAIAVLDRRSPKTKARVEHLKSLTARWAALELQVLAAPMKNEWRRLVARFAQAYESEKRVMAAHDFDDLLVYAHRALSGTTLEKIALRERMRGQFAFIFVDEYQDTSVLQAKILGLLKRADNLFMVGDVRQSIYRFRHAHPEIFLEALKRAKSLSLAENYRSRAEILGFVNKLFSRLFSGSYEKLVPRRPFTLKKKECLEWIGVPKDERSLPAHRVIEARTIASRILQWVGSGFQVEEGGKPRPVRYRDIALLLRKTTTSHLYESELESAGIPYFVNKGRGFYEKTEVADLVNFLRILERPSENIAMASVLRSPLAQVSDDALYWLSKKRLAAKTERALYGVLSEAPRISELSEADGRKIAEFMMLFERLLARKDRLKISEILHAAVRETAYEAKVLTRPEGRQAQANIWKLIEMAASVEDASVRGISDFILYLQGVADSSETEAEAKILGEEEDVVRVLTVHAAKGLEFPVVILADLGADPPDTTKPLFTCSSEQGLGARLKEPEGTTFHEDASFAAFFEDEKRKNAEQEDRLLYVAMTRAKEHLVLSGVLGGRTMKILEETLSEPGTAFHRVPIVTKGPKPAKSPRPLAALLRSAGDAPLAEELEQRVRPVTKPYEGLEDLTVSRLLANANRTTSSGDTLESEHEDANVSPWTWSEEDDIATPRKDFGTVFHLLMEWAARQTPRGPLSAERTDVLTAALTAAEKKEIAGSVGRFWKSAAGVAVRKSAKCYPELPFIYKTKHGILKGQLDLVYQEDRGDWVILDYKTNRLSDEAAKQAAVEKYRPQLGYYALAFWKLYGVVPKKTVLYFTALDQTEEVSWSETELETLNSDLETWYRKALDF